jgi:hypothetical protein
MILKLLARWGLAAVCAFATTAAVSRVLAGEPLVCAAMPAGLFTPAHPQLGRYEVCASAESLDQVRASQPAHYDAPLMVDALDAFGAAGTYDRTAVAHLYGGSRANIVRGWRRTEDGIESITLVSPYPDPTYTRLERGTLVIRYLISVSGL